jgi:hypothetical protein
VTERPGEVGESLPFEESRSPSFVKVIMRRAEGAVQAEQSVPFVLCVERLLSDGAAWGEINAQFFPLLQNVLLGEEPLMPIKLLA